MHDRRADVVALGSFHGTQEFVKNKAQELLKTKGLKGLSFQRIFELVRRIDDAQLAWHLLHYCCNYGKLMHLLRTIPPELLTDFTAQFDAAW